MHYYPHHIGDFTRETAQLTDRQAMSYLRLIWLYYETESPLADRPDLLAFKIGGDEKEVALILESYFKRDGDQWRHSRCDKEIEAYQKRSNASKKGASARWSNAGAMPEHSPSNADAPKTDANQEPITNNQEPLLKNTPRKRGASGYTPEFEQAWAAYPSRPGNSKADAFKAWSARVKEGISTEAMTAGVRKYAAYCEVTQTQPQYIKQAATFFGPGQHFDNDWTAPVLPATATPLVTPRPMQSFAERDEAARRKRWEEMTGQKWPDSQGANTIDVTPTILEVGHEPSDQSH